MRIQHNISAMNSYRQLGNNNNMLSKNLEKLSSGYRINRAGDDAAGLAISEKMRSQIKGLETAQKNANDGISLVQTAEGALTEVHSMLNRMTELATQSANGTYDNEVDRANLQKEVKALLDEIDRISESTNFNGINLLDGSLGMNTEAFSDITSTAAEATSTVAGNLNIADVVPAKDGVSTPGKASFDVSLGNIVGSAAGGNITITIGDKTSGTITVAANDTIDTIGNAIKTDLLGGGDSVTIDNTAYTVAYADGKLSFEQKVDPVKGADTITPDFEVSITDTTGAVTGEYIDHVVNTVASVVPTDVKLAEATFTIDFANLKDGSTLKIGDTTYTFAIGKDSGNTGAANKIDLTDIEEADIANNKAKITTAVVGAVGGKNGVYEVGNFDAAAGKVDLLEVTTNTTMDLTTEQAVKDSISMSTTKAEEVATTSVTVDASKMVAGDKLTIDGKTYEFVAEGGTASDNNIAVEVAGLSGKAGTATGDAAAALADAIGATATADGNKVTVSAASMTAAAPKIGSSGVKLQVGDTAEDFNKVNVKIDSTDAETLGIADIDISTQEGAAAAIEKIKTAINTVSSTRGDLGAVQNRLEHTINNLGVTTENITAAESRIRDTDMAAEMMAYTKNNILIQASQAMLAQANQVPQGVLQLLQ